MLKITRAAIHNTITIILMLVILMVIPFDLSATFGEGARRYSLLLSKSIRAIN
jgi:hypothetical protein